MTFRVRLTHEAEADLDRQFDFVLERELERDGICRRLSRASPGFGLLPVRDAQDVAVHVPQGWTKPVPARTDHPLLAVRLRRPHRVRVGDGCGGRCRSAPVEGRLPLSDLASWVIEGEPQFAAGACFSHAPGLKVIQVNPARFKVDSSWRAGTWAIPCLCLSEALG